MVPLVNMARLRLKEILDAQKPPMSKYRFAQLLGVKPPGVQSFFSEGYNPKLDTMAKWAQVLGCKISYLYDETKDKPKIPKVKTKKKR